MSLQQLAFDLWFIFLAGQNFHTEALTSGQATLEPPVRTFTVVARRHEFTPDRFEVNQFDRVRMVVQSADTSHGIRIKEFGVREEIPRGGESITVDFAANRAGRFEIRCSVYCGAGHSDMKALLVVTAPSPAGGKP